MLDREIIREKDYVQIRFGEILLIIKLVYHGSIIALKIQKSGLALFLTYVKIPPPLVEGEF